MGHRKIPVRKSKSAFWLYLYYLLKCKIPQSQEELGEKLGLGQRDISGWMKNITTPSEADIKAMAKEGMSAEEITRCIKGDVMLFHYMPSQKRTNSFPLLENQRNSPITIKKQTILTVLNMMNVMGPGRKTLSLSLLLDLLKHLEGVTEPAKPII